MLQHTLHEQDYLLLNIRYDVGQTQFLRKRNNWDKESSAKSRKCIQYEYSNVPIVFFRSRIGVFVPNVYGVFCPKLE